MRDRASGNELAQAYELLRAQADGSVILGSLPKGLAVFLRGGMPEWMATWRRLLPVSSPPPERPATESPTSVGIGREVALVLAEMALGSFALKVSSCDDRVTVARRTLMCKQLRAGGTCPHYLVGTGGGSAGVVMAESTSGAGT